jgi:hypothetical protein
MQEGLLPGVPQEMSNAKQNRIERSLTIAGITLCAIFVSSRLVLLNANYHTLRREAAINVSNITAWLEIAWVLSAATLAVVRWRSTSLRFRIVLLLNGLAVSVLVAELYSATLGS